MFKKWKEKVSWIHIFHWNVSRGKYLKHDSQEISVERLRWWSRGWLHLPIQGMPFDPWSGAKIPHALGQLSSCLKLQKQRQSAAKKFKNKKRERDNCRNVLFKSRGSNRQKQPEYVKALGNSHKEGKKGRAWGALFHHISGVEPCGPPNYEPKYCDKGTIEKQRTD